MNESDVTVNLKKKNYYCKLCVRLLTSIRKYDCLQREKTLHMQVMYYL